MDFLDASPREKNAAYDANATTTSATTGDLLISGAGAEVTSMEPMPNEFIPRMQWHLENVKRYKNDRLKNLKPWSEFFDRHRFSAPGKLEAFSRANKNLAYYFSNYVIIAACISAYILITNIWFLTAIVFSAVVYYYFKMKAALGEPVTVGSVTITTTQAYGFLAVFSLISFYYNDGSSTLFYLLLLALGSVLGHAVTHEPREEASFSFV